MKTIVVLGGSYGGARAAKVLYEGLSSDTKLEKEWRIILIERNSHANHLYVLPRYAVIPGHEHKAFIPYSNLFGPCSYHGSHVILHATITSLSSHSLTLDRAFPQFNLTDTIDFDYCVYALGSRLPAPIDVWCETEECRKGKADVLGKLEAMKKTGTKADGMEWLRRSQARIADNEVRNVLVVGGGALGIQFATDIKSVYPTKEVTLLHSRDRLLNRFDAEMHDEVLAKLQSLSIISLLSTRLDLFSLSSLSKDGTRTVRTTTGHELSCDLLLLCTGQTPNTGLISSFAPECVDTKTGLVKVGRGMQMIPISSSVDAATSSELDDLFASLGLSEELLDTAKEDSDEDSPYEHIFVIGDAADAFGAIKAGHNAYYQAEVAASNILRLISSPDEAELERYEPLEPMIKVSLGLKTSVYQMQGKIGLKEDGAEDLDAGLIWGYFGAGDLVKEDGGMLR